MPCITNTTPFYIATILMAGSICLSLHCTEPVNAQVETEEVEAANTPDRRSLFDQLWQSDSILVVYNDSHAKAYEELVQNARLERRQGQGVSFKGRKASEVTAEDIARQASLILGSWSENPWVKSLLSTLPVQCAPDGFHFDNHHFTTNEIIFKLIPYPNPQNAQMPVFLLTGNSDKEIISFLEKNYSRDWRDIFWRSWGYEVYDKGHLKILGYLSDTTWQFNKRVHFEFLQQGDTLAQSKHFSFVNQQAAISPKRLQQLQESCEANYQHILAFTGAADPQLNIPYHLYPSSESKGLQLNNTQEAQLDLETKQIHVIESKWLSGSHQHLESVFLLREVLGAPKWSPFEIGLATFLNKDWFEKGYLFWANKLNHAGALPELKQLQNEQWWEESSDLIQALSAAAFVDFLVDHWGREKFLAAYKSWRPGAEDIRELSLLWENFKQVRFTKNKGQNPPKFNLPYCKGFNFAHEGYRIYNGYGSAQAIQSMERLQQLGTNVIGLVPYSFMGNPNVPSPIPNINGPGMENDESTVFSHYHAKELGMATMLKPQIWLGRSWPGDISFDTEEKWATFFDHYSRWIIHYALLAEMHGFDIFCIGVEFVKATTQRPDEWRKLIAKIRQVYSGPITYAANWGEEFEQLSFWEDLDFIGLNCYYPLSKEEHCNKRTLAKAFKQVLQKAEKISKQAKRPLLFTEIGFRSTQSPWINPHADADGRSFNEEHQDWCYETVFKAIEGKDWVHGIFWWKWPSYLGYQGRENTSFTPNRKRAEETVKRYFRR